MKSPFSFWTSCLLWLALVLTSAGCQHPSLRTPSFVISLNRVAQPNAFAPETLLIHGVGDTQGQTRTTVSKFPIVDSSCFFDVQLVQGPEQRWGLRLLLDKRGQHLWRTATAQYHGLRLAISVDGFFAGFMTFPQFDESGCLFLPALWNENEARRIAEHVQNNYRLLNSL